MKVLLAVVLAIESLRDIKSRQVWIVLPGVLMIVGILNQWMGKEIKIREFAASFMVVLATVIVSKITKEALGMGDVWVIGCIMSICGLVEGMESILLAFVFSAVYGGVLLVKGNGKNTQIPFVPFLFLGVLGGVWLL